MNTQEFRLHRRTRGIFAWSGWDIIPVLAAFAHLAFVIWIVAGFAGRPWWGNVLCGCGYALAISWNINGVSHNFLHTPYFRLKWLNRAFSLLESVTIGFSQTFYTWVHLRHHEGNSDRPDAEGRTRDWLSIYRYGRQCHSRRRCGGMFYFNMFLLGFVEITAGRSAGKSLGLCVSKFLS